MKSRISNPFRSGISAVLTVLTLGCLAAPSVSAATRFWSGNGTTQGGGGTWDTNLQRWGSVAAGPYTLLWNNLANDTAEFNTATGTATLGTDITVGGINQKTGSTGVSIAEGAGLNSITLGSATTIFNVAANTTVGRTLNVNAEVTGGNNLSIQGPTTTAGGDVNLNRVNTFTGTLSIDDTVLRIGNGGTAGQLNSGNYSAAISITSTGTFGYSSSLNQTLGGVISGAGVLNKNTAGSILTLTNSNTYTGATNINGGKLIGVVGGHHQNSDVTLNNVAAATYGVSITDNTKSWTCKSLACAAAGTLEFNFGAVTPSDTVSPLVVTNLAAFTATPLVNVVVSAGLSPGIYPLMTWGSTSGTAPATPQLTVSNVAAGTVPSLSVSGNTLILVIASTASSVVKDDNALPLNNGNSWGGGLAPTAGEVAKWNNIVTSANTTNLGADTTWTGITIENPNGLVTIDGTNILTLGAATIDIDMGTATADLGLNCPLALGAANIWNVAPTRTLTLGGKVSGAFGITKLAAGTAILTSSANDYTGNTTVSTGTLRLGANNVIPDGAANGNVAVNGILDLNGNSETLNGLSGNGVIDNTLAATSPVLSVGNNDQTSTFDGVIQSTTGSVNFVKTGNGTLTLNGANTFTGTVAITAGTGTLAAGNVAPFNNVTGISMGGGTTLRSQVTGTTVQATTPITLGAAATTSTITAPLLPSNSTGATTAKTFEVKGAISGDGNLTLLGVNPYNQYGTVILSAQSSYTGSTLITCSDVLTPIGNEGNQNLFVRLSIADALPATTVLTLDGGDGPPLATGAGRYCELNLNGNNQTIAGLTNVGGRNLRVQRVVNNSVTTATFTVNNAGNHIYSGHLGWVSGVGSSAYDNFNLTKSGVGTQTFNGPLRYNGHTTVNSGILSLGSANPNNELANITIAASGAKLHLNYAGTDTVGKLFFGATQQAAGTYGHTDSGATNGGLGVGALNAYFEAGTGTLTVTTGPFDTWKTTNSATGQTLGQDHDGDGVSNGVEYFIGGPNTITTGFTPLPGVTPGSLLSVTWAKAGSYIGSYGPGGYEVQISSSLDSGSWSAAVTSVTPNTANTVYINGNNVTYTFPAGSKNFARLKVAGP